MQLDNAIKFTFLNWKRIIQYHSFRSELAQMWSCTTASDLAEPFGNAVHRSKSILFCVFASKTQVAPQRTVLPNRKQFKL